MSTLSPEEKARIGAQFEQVMELFARRHGVTEHEIVEAVQWVHKHKEWLEAMKRAGFFSLIGFLISAALLAFWEGIKAAVGNK